MRQRNVWSMIVAVGVAIGLLAIAEQAGAQSAVHRNGFETKVGWLKGGFDAPYDELAHRIDDRDPHNGRGSELIDIDAKQGKYIHFIYPVGKAPINEDLRVSVWLRGNRAGMKLLARIVLPKERDPNNLDYLLTTYIEGEAYQQTGQWQLIEIPRPVLLAKKQQQAMNGKEPGRNYDFTGAYIDALVLNVYAGPGPTRAWIDDLEIGPVTDAPPVAALPDNNNPPKNVVVPRKNSVVEFNANRLVIGNQRLFFRAVRYTDTTLPVLRNAGFNTVCFDPKVNLVLVKEATDLGLWVVPELRVMNEKGQVLSPEEIAKEAQRFADNDAVIFRRLNGLLAFEHATPVARAVEIARQADPGRPLCGDVVDGLLPYSRTINLVGVHRFPLMTTLELPKYREWLDARRRLANPGVFTWTWIQTHLPDWYAELLYNQDARAEFRTPVGPQPEQIRLLAYSAIASGMKGLAFWSDRFLADSHQGRDRLLCCALLNQEIEMIEPMLVTADETVQWIDTSVADVKAAVLRCNQGVLVIPIWQGRFSQFVPAQAAAAKLTMTVPQVPKTAQAWEVSPGDVRGLKMERVDTGMRITLPEFGLTSTVVFTSDTQFMGRLQDQSRARRQLAAQWSYDMAFYEYEKVVGLQPQLEQLGGAVPDANMLLADCKKRLQKSKDLWEGRNFSEAYLEAQRALRPLRILMRAQWEKAVRGLDTPVASPYAVSYYTLPKHWQFVNQIQPGKATVGPNQLRGGDFEMPADRRQELWRPDRHTLDEVDLIAERVTELAVTRVEPVDPKADPKKTDAKKPITQVARKVEFPVEGKQCAMLQVKPRVGRAAPAALERTVVALVSPDVKLPPGTLVQVSGWVNIPAPITGSQDGALIYDSAGGEPLAIRMTSPLPWRKFTVYRRIPASGTINVTLALTGVGTVYFDDIRVEPIVPSGAVVPAGN
ncbi:MAG: hypothetical protein FJ303_20565 [Planctomycetes bacterium]|nr:hypothetical protein [Planctomycetota bacterium]